MRMSSGASAWKEKPRSLRPSCSVETPRSTRIPSAPSSQPASARTTRRIANESRTKRTLVPKRASLTRQSSSAASSQSIASSSPNGAEASRRSSAIPPSPTVASTKRRPVCGRTASIISSAMTGMWRPRRSRSGVAAGSILSCLSRESGSSFAVIAAVLKTEVVESRRRGGIFVGLFLLEPLVLRPDQEFFEIAGEHGFLRKRDRVAKILREQNAALAVENELLRRVQIATLADAGLELLPFVDRIDVESARAGAVGSGDDDAGLAFAARELLAEFPRDGYPGLVVKVVEERATKHRMPAGGPSSSANSSATSRRRSHGGRRFPAPLPPHKNRWAAHTHRPKTM